MVIDAPERMRTFRNGGPLTTPQEKRLFSPADRVTYQHVQPLPKHEPVVVVILPFSASFSCGILLRSVPLAKSHFEILPLLVNTYRRKMANTAGKGPLSVMATSPADLSRPASWRLFKGTLSVSVGACTFG
jgi:hypothetical protein